MVYHDLFCLFVLAYNLGNFLRRLALPTEMSSWSLTSLKESANAMCEG